MTLTIGLDMSLTSPGVAVIEDGVVVHVANIKTTGRRMLSKKYPNGATIMDRRTRLRLVLAFVAAEVEHFTHVPDGFTESGEPFSEIDMAVIEGPAMGSTMGSPHDRSGLWWHVVDMLAALNIPIQEVAPAARAKYLTGSGRADKDVVLAHAIERYQPSLDAAGFGQKIGRCDDIADAIGLADMGARRLGKPVPCVMPEKNLEAMDGVLWTA